MSDAPQTPETPKHRFDKEYEDPHYHDEDDITPVEDAEPHTVRGHHSPRRKLAYRPRRRLYEE